MPPSPIRTDELFAAWSKRQFHRVYLFAGQEDFLIEDAIQQLAMHVLGDDLKGINHERLDAEAESVESILQLCQTMPFGAPVRFIEVSQIGKLPSEDQKYLAQGLTHLPESTHLVMVWGKEWRRDDAERPLIKAAMSVGAAVIFWPMYPENAQRWLIQRARKYKKALDPRAAAWLVQEAGEGLRRLDQELLKACGYVGEKNEINLDDVAACFGYQKAQSPFEWLTAVRQRKTAQSLQLLRHLLDDDEEPLKLLAMATNTIKDAVKTGEVPDGLAYCVEAHQSIKSGKETPEMALTLLNLRLCGLDSLNA